MTKILIIIATILGVSVTLFVTVIAGTVIGGFVGWCVNFIFPVVNTTLNQVSGLSLDAFDMGAVLGFLGGFIRSSTSKDSK